MQISFSPVPLYISPGWKMEALFPSSLLLEIFFKHLKQKTGRDSGFGMEKVPVNLPTTWFRNASLVGFIEGISIKINWPLCYLAPQTRSASLYSGHDPQINFCLGSKLSVCHWIKDLNGGFVYWASKLAPFDPFFSAGFEYIQKYLKGIMTRSKFHFLFSWSKHAFALGILSGPRLLSIFIHRRLRRELMPAIWENVRGRKLKTRSNNVGPIHLRLDLG